MALSNIIIVVYVLARWIKVAAGDRASICHVQDEGHRETIVTRII